MSVTAGYKMTEAGMIPNDWEIKPLAQVCRQIVDGTHFTPSYTADGVPFYSVENVTANDFTNVKFISQKDHEFQSRRCNPEKGDILMTRIGSIADTRFINWDVKASIYVSLALLKVGEEINPRYLYAYSRSQTFKRSVENRSLMSAIPKKINMGAIGEVPIPVPPTDTEQDAVAQALGDIDDLITSLDALIAKKRDIKQGAMQQLLTGKRRLPGYTGEWRSTTLGKVAKIGTGNRNNQDKSVDGDYPFFVRSQDIERIGTYSYDCEAILVPGEGNIGRIYHYIKGKFEAHQRVYVLRDFHSDAECRFVHLFMRQFFEQHAMANTVKATVDSLRRPTFESFEILLPASRDEQCAVADAISDLESEEGSLVAKRSKLDELRQGMMQQLLTGRIRLV